jgi:hypothetical protein
LRQRSYLIGATILVAALVTSVVAIAATERTYEQTFAADAKGKPTTTPGAGVGTHLVWTATDPANTANNQPTPDEYVEVVFPKGSTIDQSGIPSCTATDEAILKRGAAACPKDSKVGSGTGVLAARDGNVGVAFTVFNCAKGCRRGTGIPPTEGEMIIISQTQTDNNGVHRASISASMPNIKRPPPLRAWVENRGSGIPGIHIPLEVVCVDGAPPACGAAGDARIVKVDVLFPPRRGRGVATGKRGGAFKVGAARRGRGVATGIHGGAYLMFSPPKCPASRAWVFTLIAHGRDGADDVLTSKSPCKAK